MTEITIFGRGGQGGVTLAKLIAEAYFLKGRYVQAFGVYAAERSGAPVQAYVRIDDQEITNHNEIATPDHAIVLDRNLIGPRILFGLHPAGWVVLNTSDAPSACVDLLAGRNVATVDATAIAISHGLGTRTVPIVNTTMAGAVGRVLGLSLSDVEASLAELGFKGANLAAAREAYEWLRTETLPGELQTPTRPPASPPVSLLDPGVGGPPQIRTGTWATRRPDRRRLTPPCNHACPAGNDVQGFVAAVAQGEVDRALGILLETSPLPGVCGRVCPAPCMASCNRTGHDEAVNVRELERYVADHGRVERSPLADRHPAVAVVGSGPAGLSAAYALARNGHPVTLYEADAELGGVLRTGIPTYRLPRDVLDREIAFILAHGVSVKAGQRLSSSDIGELTNEFAAVFVATGLQKPGGLDLGLVGGCDRVEQGIAFLDRARCNGVQLAHERVVVVGGGNTAIDAARSARRLGAHSVSVVYRRTRREMPAIGEEIEAALEEGITLSELVAPLRLREQRGPLLLTCQRMRLGKSDQSGRGAPIPEDTEDAFFDVACDRVILALGQAADRSVLSGGDGEAFDSCVVCGGDFASAEGTVAAAIGSGRQAALDIHAALAGRQRPAAPIPPVAGREVVTAHVFPHSSQHRGDALGARQRRHSLEEVHRGLALEDGHRQAVVEADRCFSCGVCNWCDRCVQHCPEGILYRDRSGYHFDFDYCKGCGICAVQCPRGVIYMSEL